MAGGEFSAVGLFIIRFLMGIAIGGEYSIGMPLMTEFSPARLRGRLLGAALVAWYVGCPNRRDG